MHSVMVAEELRAQVAALQAGDMDETTATVVRKLRSRAGDRALHREAADIIEGAYRAMKAAREWRAT